MLISNALPITLLLLLFLTTMVTVHNTHICPKGTTAHYIYTYPVQKECVHEIVETNMTTLNNNNIQYN
jgi:hypothetical protein